MRSSAPAPEPVERGAPAEAARRAWRRSVLPGGESPTISKGMEREGLFEPLRERGAGRHARARHLRRRDPAGPARSRTSRSRASACSTWWRSGTPTGRRWIRSRRRSTPTPTRPSPACAASSSHRCCAGRARRSRCWRGWTARPVLVRQGRILAATFHPELTEDLRVHAALLSLAAGVRPVCYPSRPRGTSRPARFLSSRGAGRARRTARKSAGGSGTARARPRGGRMREFETTFIVQPEISDEPARSCARASTASSSKQRREPPASCWTTGASASSPTRSRSSRRATTSCCTTCTEGKVVPETGSSARCGSRSPCCASSPCRRTQDSVADIEARMSARPRTPSASRRSAPPRRAPRARPRPSGRPRGRGTHGEDVRDEDERDIDTDEDEG